MPTRNGAGAAWLGPLFRAVSPAVVHAMLSGIGVLIFASQFHVMVDDRPKANGIENSASIPAAVQKAFANPAIPPRELRARQRDVLQRIGELLAQGVVNVLCGLAGALPMTGGVIARGRANVDWNELDRLAGRARRSATQTDILPTARSDLAPSVAATEMASSSS